jgi:putative FmdB family regulatory protein
MPLYDFRCRSCGAEFEEYAAVGMLPPCPACGACEPERVLSGFAGPFKVGLRGREAKRSNDTRRAREERRQDGFARQREERKQRGE